MKKTLILVLSFSVALWFSGMTHAAAQGNKGQGGGKPASTGLEHAEATANSKGVEHGIENAESKQGNEDADASKTNKSKAKGKKHKHNKKNSHAASH
jgi:hypothetical protein